MGNLLSQLGKDFVRSAVKQVGRDGGKVISNHVYGDAHSTPVRGSDSMYSIYSDVPDASLMAEFKCDGIMDLDNRKRAEEAGYKPVGGLNHWIGCFGVIDFIIVIGLLFAACAYYKSCALIFFVVVMIRAFNKFRTKSRKLTKPYRQMTYETDRRYKTGRRYAGDVVIDHEITVELYKEEKKVIYKRTAMYVVIAFLLLFAGSIKSYMAPYYHQMEEEQKQQKAIQSDMTQDQESVEESIDL